MKEKKAISFILTLAMIFSMVTGFTTVGFVGTQEDVFADATPEVVDSGICGDPEVNGGADVTWTLDDTGLLTISGSGEMADFEPSNDVPWRDYNATSISAVSIDSGITKIGKDAFYYCTNLKSVILKSGLETIGMNAFHSCSKLTTITIPASVTSIGINAFAHCNRICSISFLGASKPAINVGAFSKMAYTGRVRVTSASEFEGMSLQPEGQTEMSLSTSTSKWKLVETETPADLTEAGDFGTNAHYSFDPSTHRLTITASGTPASMPDFSNPEDAPWSGVAMLIESLSISGVSNIGAKAFYTGVYYTYLNLKSVSINDVTKIGENAFRTCDALETVSLGNVTTLENNAFRYCRSLTSVDLTSVTAIGESAFQYCEKLSEIKVGALESVGDDAFSDIASDVVVKVDYENVDALDKLPSEWTQKIIYPWIHEGNCGTAGHEDEVTWKLDTSTGALTISGTGGMANYANFSATPWHEYASDIKTLAVEEGVTIIGNYAFDGCSNLTAATMPSVKTIGNNAFSSCSALTSISMDEVETISNSAFQRCSTLTTADMPNVTTIDWSAFDMCSALTTVNMPKIATIGNSAFGNCTALQAVNLHGIASIGNTAFHGCSNLTAIDIPASVVNMGRNAFEKCEELASITIRSNNLTFINTRTTSYDCVFSGVSNSGVIYVNGASLAAIAESGLDIKTKSAAWDSSPVQITATDSAAGWHFAAIPTPPQENRGGGGGGGKAVVTTEQAVTAPAITTPAVTAPAVTRTYKDIPAGSWFADAADFCAKYGIITGISEGEFGGSLNTQRGQIVTMLMRLENIKGHANETYTNGLFGDVKGGAYYADAIAWAAKNNIVKGMGTDANGNANFGATQAVTREQLATILYNFAKYRNLDTNLAADTNAASFKDAANVSAYANDALLWAIQNGIITGTSTVDENGNPVVLINPQGTATRAEIATMIKRLCDHFAGLI